MPKLNNENVIWFDGDSTNIVKEDYILKLAMQLGIQNIKEFSNINILLIYKVKAYQDAIIYILDNVENYEDIKGIVDSQTNNSHLVISPRDNNLIVNSGNTINLKAFNEKESYNYLKRAIVIRIIAEI